MGRIVNPGMRKGGLRKAGTPDSSITKDVPYFRQIKATTTSTPPSWQRYYQWGAVRGASSGTAGGYPTPANVLYAIPQHFSRRARIDDIKVVWGVSLGSALALQGIYANYGDGYVYPGALIESDVQRTVNTSGSVYSWAPSGAVTPGAGTLLWYVYGAGSFVTATSMSCQYTITPSECAGLLGLDGATSFSSGMPTDTSCALSIARTWNGSLPTQFPVAGAITYFGANQIASRTIIPSPFYKMAG